MTASVWTETRVARLKTLWLEGRTAEQIAADLQDGVTRSAVLGKVYRMGLSADRPERPVGRKTPARRPARSGTRPAARPDDRTDVQGTGTLQRPTAGDLASGGLGILTVRRGQCRWPYDEPGGVTFCGRPVARGAFCAAHAEVGYRTPPGNLASLQALASLA